MAGIKPKDLTQNYTGDAAVTWVHGDNATTSVSERVSIQNIIDATGVASKIDSAEKGANSGLATLDASGLVPTSQLPSYVDDVLEYADEASFPVTGETAKIYVALDVNLTFRWSGSAYIEISKSLALGETETTAYRGDRGKLAYDHSQLVHDKAFVGLGNVDNTADADKPLTEEAKLLAATVSKAEFFALAEQRKRESAGSGSLEWGKHFSNGAEHRSINQGIWSANTQASVLYMGAEAPVSNDSTSRTFSPIQLVDGVQHKITNVNTASAAETNAISFPDAPDGTKTYDSATGVVTPHATSNEAFEGLCTNGDFRNGDDGSWIKSGVTVSALGIDFSGSSGAQECYQDTPIPYVDFDISFTATTTGTIQVYLYGTGAQDGSINISVVVGRNKVTLPISSRTSSFGTDDRLSFRDSDGTKFNGTISNISIIPTTVSVITSRKDLVFLETWHEAIDVVYPLGNVQYGAVTYKGIALDNTLVAQGYSAFGAWDTTTTGHGALWSTMTFDDRMKFIEDPENNIYFDSETNQYIQVRHRVSVIEGLGDEWGDGVSVDSTIFRYGTGDLSRVYAQGSGTTSKDFTASTSSSFGGFNSASVKDDNNDILGEFHTVEAYTRGHNGKCFAVPICLVQRLNQGAMHPVYNPQGCAMFASISGSQGKWLEGKHVVNSKSDCFIPWINGVTSGYAFGYISSSLTGRSDQYEFYDPIYAGMVEDLRLNANKLDLNRLLEDSKRSDVAGTTRGKSKVPFTKVTSLPISDSSSIGGGSRKLIYNSVNHFNLDDGQEETVIGSYLENSGVLRKVLTIAYALTNTYITLDGTTNYTSVCNAVIGRTDILSAEYDSIPHVDLIGDPANIALTFPDGVIGEWIPVIPDGTTKDFSLNRKSIDSILDYVRTIDGGVNWNTGNRTVDTVTNSINMSSGIVPTNAVIILHYESLSDFTEPSANSKVIGQVGDVFASQAYVVEDGNRLIPSLIGKVATTANTYPYSQTHSLTSKGYTTSTGVLQGHADFKPRHNNLGLPNPLNLGPAVKVLSTFTEIDGLIYPQYHFAELKHDGTDWGDDNTIPIVDNMSTKTDDNAVTVSIGCHTGKIPLGIA